MTDPILDPSRLAALRATGLLDSPSESSFDRLTRLAARLLKAPVALVSLVDSDRQFFKSSVGLPDYWALARQTPLSHSFCRHVVITGMPLVIEDARTVPEHRTNLAICDLGVVSYMGVPLTTEDGYVLGAFCVIDNEPRQWIEADLLLLRDLADSVTAEIALRVDKAELQLAKELLTRSENRVRGILESSLDCLFMTDHEGKLVEFNPASERAFGVRREEVIEKSFADLFIPNDFRSVFESGIELFLESGERRGLGQRIEIEAIRQGGERFPAELAISVVVTGGTFLFSASLRDITDRKEFESALRMARDAAMEAARAKSDFLANMSHEVRTPMAAVLGYSDMLLNPRLLQVERDQALQAIRRNGSHLLQIINDILDLSKIEADRMELDLIRYSPWQVALEVASALRIRADEKGVGLQTLALGPLPESSIMDPTRVRQILVNLVGNAIKFSEAGGLVALKMEATPTGLPGQVTLRIEIKDQGIGMSQSEIDQLFIPFQQADSSTTRKFGGTGLGLSISRQLAKAMDGSIMVESEPGRGSSFTVSIPLLMDERNRSWLEPDQLAIRVTPEPNHADDRLGRVLSGRVLLAEDNPDNQKVLLYHLCRMGLEVVVVDNGRIAVEKALRGFYDLILMDMQMPELDGYGATSSLRRAGFHQPIIALTAHAMAEDREKCLNVGCTDFLTKPIEAKTLADAIARHLGTGQNQFKPPDDFIVSRFRDDPDLKDLIRWFVAELPERVERLRSMTGSGDLVGIKSLAHQLRGVGGMYGYPALTDTAGLIEEAADEQREGQLLEELVEEFADLVEQIDRGLDG
jgi:PAS domain S-box-containing protein